MIAFGLDAFGIVNEGRVLRQVEPGPLRLRQPFLHPDESPDDLSEVHLGQNIGRVDADTEPRNIDAFAHHIYGNKPLLVLMLCERGDRL